MIINRTHTIPLTKQAPIGDCPFSFFGAEEMLSYTYTAEKLKLIAQGNPGTIRYYFRNLEVEKNQANEFVPVSYNHPDGKMYFSYEPTTEQDPLSTRFQFNLHDHLGNVMVVFEDRDKDGAIDPNEGHGSSEVRERFMYYSFGMQWSNAWRGIEPGGKETNRYRYNSKEWHKNSRLLDYGFRYYDPVIGRFTGVDPLADRMPSYSTYTYTFNNPISLIDPDGREPIKPLVGTASQFRTLLNNSPRKVGAYTGTQASNYLKSLGNTEFSWKQMRPLPTETGYFNNKKGRYIYTEKGGWVDMAHFMFYAGKAYQYKLDGKENPIGAAVQDGYMQEASDKYAAKHSAYSYEDLPSDKFGAVFAVNHFDPNSKQTFGEQLENYLNNVLKATDPQNAPNYDQLPTTEPKTPTRTNTTTTPVYTKDNP